LASAGAPPGRAASRAGPTYRTGLERRGLLGIAGAVNDLFARDRNRGAFPERYLPPSRTLSRREVTALIPELETAELTGGALFYDAQMYSSERLVLEVVLSAVEAGAVAVNHVEVERPVVAGRRLIGAGVRDRLSGDRFDVGASIIVSAAGPATYGTAERLLGRQPTGSSRHSVALNIMVPGLGHTVAFSIAPRAAVSMSSRKLFVVPWRGRTMIGTAHYPFDGDPADFRAP